MTFNQMRYFYEVCKFQNITKAAQFLHVSQPTISVAIQELENETNLNLFHRQGRKIFITQDGNKLFGKISNILQQIQDLDDEIHLIANNRNHISLAIPPQIGTILLPYILGDFHNKYPQIKLDIVETGGIDSLNLLENEKIDLAITNYQMNFQDKFVYRKLFYCECCFCTCKTNFLRKKESLTINDIANEQLVMLDSSFFICQMINNLYEKHHLTPNIIHYSPHLHSIKNLVKNQIASTFLLRQAILPEDNILIISLNDPIFIDSGIVTKKGKKLYSDTILLIKYLQKSICGKLPSKDIPLRVL